MIFDFPGQPPREVDSPEAVANLVRKGWTQRPDRPPIDPLTQQVAWDGGEWVVSPLPPAPVPDALARHIAEEVLLRQPHPIHGTHWDAVLALVASMPDGQRRIFEARLKAPSIRRESSTVAGIAAALGWSEQWIDDRFRDGAALAETV